MKNKLLKQKLNDLADLFQEINNLWEDADEDTYEKMSEEYPFAESFDDLGFEVRHWAQHLNKKL